MRLNSFFAGLAKLFYLSCWYSCLRTLLGILAFYLGIKKPGLWWGKSCRIFFTESNLIQRKRQILHEVQSICVWSPALRGSPPGSHLCVLGGSRSTPWSGVTPENTRESDLEAWHELYLCFSSWAQKVWTWSTYLHCSKMQWKEKPFYICKEEDTLPFS